MSFPAARWLCTVRQRPLPALPPLPGSLGAAPPLLKVSSPGGGTDAGFSPSRPSRSTASPAAAATLALARRVPLEAPQGSRARGAPGVAVGERGQATRGGGGGGVRGGKTMTDKRKKETERGGGERQTDKRQTERERETCPMSFTVCRREDTIRHRRNQMSVTGTEYILIIWGQKVGTNSCKNSLKNVCVFF